MEISFGIAKKDRVMWAMCIAAYILVADYFSPLCIVRVNLNEGIMVEETPLGSSLQEDRFITIVATLAMYAALNTDPDMAANLEQIPETLLNAIAEMLRERQKKVDREVVLKERDRLLEMVSEILRGDHMYHLRLAAALLEKPITTDVIEALKDRDNTGNAA